MISIAILALGASSDQKLSALNSRVSALSASSACEASCTAQVASAGAMCFGETEAVVRRCSTYLDAASVGCAQCPDTYCSETIIMQTLAKCHNTTARYDISQFSNVCEFCAAGPPPTAPSPPPAVSLSPVMDTVGLTHILPGWCPSWNRKYRAR